MPPLGENVQQRHSWRMRGGAGVVVFVQWGGASDGVMAQCVLRTFQKLSKKNKQSHEIRIISA